ncbi:MAG: cyclic nucleotide-binding domain-containing protein [Gammaproteobacteria bacterium]|nr:cyclic nucleotide-binding domain-containing protein [Gammaproteobacteria bacterium]
MNRLDLFRALRVEDKKIMIEKKLVTMRAYEEGEALIKFGQAGKEFFMLMSGTLDVMTESGHKVAEIQPGQFFGEVAFLLNEPRTANIVAHDKAVVMVLDNNSLNLMPIRCREVIKDKLIAGLIGRVKDLNTKLEKSAQQKSWLADES